MLISFAYIEHPSYKLFVNNSTNRFLAFCKNLATKGTSLVTYKERLNLLSTIFKQDTGVTKVIVIDARCNVLHMVSKFFKDTPSVFEKSICNNGCYINDIACPSVIIKLSNGLESLQNDINEYLNSYDSICELCNGNKTHMRYLKEHLFIETDMYFENKETELNKLPVQIVAQGKRYLLIGVVHYANDHYIAYLKKTNIWEIHNDLTTKIKKVKDSKIRPHVLMYVN